MSFTLKRISISCQVRQEFSVRDGDCTIRSFLPPALGHYYPRVQSYSNGCLYLLRNTPKAREIKVRSLYCRHGCEHGHHSAVVQLYLYHFISAFPCRAPANPTGSLGVAPNLQLAWHVLIFPFLLGIFLSKCFPSEAISFSFYNYFIFNTTPRSRCRIVHTLKHTYEQSNAEAVFEAECKLKQFYRHFRGPVRINLWGKKTKRPKKLDKQRCYMVF